MHINSSFGHKKQKVNYKLLIFKLVQFQQDWAQKLVRLSCRFRKCIVTYTLDVPILVKGWGSDFNGHRP